MKIPKLKQSNGGSMCVEGDLNDALDYAEEMDIYVDHLNQRIAELEAENKELKAHIERHHEKERKRMYDKKPDATRFRL